MWCICEWNAIFGRAGVWLAYEKWAIRKQNTESHIEDRYHRYCMSVWGCGQNPVNKSGRKKKIVIRMCIVSLLTWEQRCWLKYWLRIVSVSWYLVFGVWLGLYLILNKRLQRRCNLDENFIQTRIWSFMWLVLMNHHSLPKDMSKGKGGKKVSFDFSLKRTGRMHRSGTS